MNWRNRWASKIMPMNRRASPKWRENPQQAARFLTDLAKTRPPAGEKERPAARLAKAEFGVDASRKPWG